VVHLAGARRPAGFQDANYFARGGDAASGEAMRGEERALELYVLEATAGSE
jgi:hypothetical protein